jgi:hypothetical protein
MIGSQPYRNSLTISLTIVLRDLYKIIVILSFSKLQTPSVRLDVSAKAYLSFSYLKPDSPVQFQPALSYFFG